MENAIKEYCNKYYVKYVPIPDNSIGRIYNLLIKDTFEEPITDIDMFYYGTYYKYIKNDYVNMKKYLLIAIEAGNSDAMNALGYYYQVTEDDYDNMKKYYLLAIEKGNSEAMTNMGHYYKRQKDYDNMKKYYLMAIEAGHSSAMSCLGYYYYKQKDDENMLKYYLMAIEAGDSYAMYNLGYYYEKQKDDKNMLKYYLMAIEAVDFVHAMDSLVSYYKRQNNYNEIIELYIKTKNYEKFQETLEYMIKNDKSYNEQTIKYIIDHGQHFTDNCNFILKQYYNSLKQKIDLMELHFKYTDNGLGMKEAKDDFILQLTVKN